MHPKAKESIKEEENIPFISKLVLGQLALQGFFFGKDELLWICTWKCYLSYVENYMHKRDGFCQKVPKSLGDTSKGGGGEEVSVQLSRVCAKTLKEGYKKNLRNSAKH